MWRALFLSVALILPVAVQAQDRAETLADIRQELSVLYVELQRLRGELNTTGAPLGSGGVGGTLQRVDAIEAELRRLTSLTEELQLRVDRVVRDGTNRVGDLEFRLCELEEGCDIADLGDTPSLGGEEPVAGPITPPVQAGGGAALAVGEQTDFDRAQAALDAGSYSEAADLFTAFTQTYPGGPLSAEAHFFRGEAEAAQENWSAAARAYLDSFSGAPDAPRAPESLTRLGTSLGQLGQTEEACLTLAEVELRYPGSPAVLNARSAMTNLGCS
ncbi:tol-pal system protein YbgF [Roseobacter sp. HKCCD9010]|uniref:tol-pal system protein YbgF n=1 Tax=unclassified Roseobacter TaxID=196798 RepID=UPI001491B359|nr:MULTISPECIES: tol-pal system protein YbgF [unclassified Roseobacter]MBF9049123.1 tol-pal system protein YbgF [Rhodobacterales bacterium HKCCD4356]NNV11123.1 tol-pal system protein YbgF [Roseobacter sp. HKCCD7357]NNV15307.1 tol-pal system protein YbgF [Roseobacter sp. HKCCD8768]NNV24767.1 tol-pal system protein YbgF [Roseobacter sp. HKCCD8192]NNV29023.1 tol-pal system protein YbgF [Roseobacter sp. HKCCD9061]